MLNILENVSLAPLTTFKIGGAAKFFIKVESLSDLSEALNFAKQKGEQIFVLAGGSNILVSDDGFNGLVIQIPFSGWKDYKDREAEFLVRDSEIFVHSGIAFSKVLGLALQNNLSGLEWGVGIPGTIGGAVRGNSGAFGKGLGDFVEKVEVFDIAKMEKAEFGKEECRFAYRESFFKKNKNLIILKAVLRLTPDEKENIQRKMKENTFDRAKKNSAILGKSAGCYFKNIPWESVDKEYLIQNFPEIRLQVEKPKLSTGFLIDLVGLKGAEVGAACVPNEHANYIINKNNAAAKDVLALANLIREKIFDKYKIVLKEEVELVGF